MTRTRKTLRLVGILGAALLVAGGCGGEDAIVPDPNAVAPVDTTAPGTTAADPGAVDPATGAPLDPALDGGGETATVPDLVGDDVSGGLASLSGTNTPLFDAQAVTAVDLAEQDKSEADADKAESDAKDTPAVTYSGASIYVDGITHSVNKNGTFPKGNPVFQLLSVSANDIEIALVAGEFTSSGGDGTFLDLGDMVSLVNASEQITYRVKYLRPIKSTSAISF